MPLDAIATRVAEVESREVSAGERRHLTVLFCDLVGSTEISSKLDPEEWREALGRYHRAATEEIIRFGGHVAKYLGDGVMALFGYPEAHDDDAERAARAGLAILDALAKLNAPVELSARLGIDSGAVVVGPGESKGADVFGETPNIAERVQALAEPGTMMITSDMHRLVSGLFVVEERGERTLKGKEAAQTLYRIVRPSGMRGRFEASVAAGGLTPFVGREDELESLTSRWERVRDGDGQVVTIIGEAGIGKSRLVRRFHEVVDARPHTWLEAGAGALFQNSPFYPIRDLLRQLLNKTAERDPYAQLESRLVSDGLTPADAIPLIAPLVNLAPSAKYPGLTISPEQQRRRLFAVLAEWLLGAARTQPLVIMIEDLHWIDPSTMELIKLLVDPCGNAPLLLLCTARPEFRPSWQSSAHSMQLRLTRLSAKHVRAMVGQVAATGNALSDETIARVVERSGGVPLFVEELTRSVLESGETQQNGRDIPATLQDSLMARLDRLGPAKEVAQVGAVIGFDFTYGLLRALLPVAEESLQSALHKLVDSDLVYFRGIVPEPTYQFRHALIRDAAYEALLKSHRRQLHARVAGILEEKFPDLAKSHPEVVARHYTEGALISAALPYWQRAGQLAVERSANLEAIDHLTRGIELSRKLVDTAERAQQELRLQIILGGVLVATKGFAAPDVRSTYARARALCENSGEAPQLFPVLFGLWVYYYVRGEILVARELAEKQCLRLALSVQDPALLLEAHLAYGATLFHIGELSLARSHVEQSLSLYDGHAHRSHMFVYGQDPGTVSGIYMSFILWHLGFPDQALRTIKKAVVLAGELKHSFTSAFALLGAAWVHQLRHEVETVQAEAEKALAISIEHGFPLWSGMATVLLGWSLAEQGDAEEGIEQIRKGWKAFQATGGGLQAPFFLSLLTQACLKAGRLEEGRAALTEALTCLDENCEHSYEAEIYRLRGQYLASDQVHEEAKAERCFRSAIELSRFRNARLLELRATTSLARLLALQNRRGEARAVLGEIHSWFTEGFDTTDLEDAKTLLDELNA